MTSFRHLALATLALPLALAACGGTAEEGATSGDPIAPIAAPAGTEWVDTVQVTEADGYLLGNPDAPIKLIEYGSLTCGACAQFTETAMEELKSKYVASGRVSLELRNQVHNGLDLMLARLVRCGAPESMHPLSEQVWLNLEQVLTTAQADQQALETAMRLPEDQRFPAAAQAAGFLDFFASRGLSRDQAATCLADTASVTAIAERSDAQSKELGISSTPTFILNGRVLDERSWPELEAALQRAGAR
ncbi:DsbA family protein [Leptolyngbya sp. 15MV]|nr:DsbA family protein [Leptolyngbya sp. 15MV]